MKSIIALATLSALSATPAIAGPYVNVEANSGFVGDNYSATQTDAHAGYEGGNERWGYYVQAGPSFVNSDGGANDTEFSGKVGGSVKATEKLNVYGEVAFITTDADTNNYGTKVGVKWTF